MAGNNVKLRAVLEDRVSSGLDKIRDKFDQLGGKGSAASLFGNVTAKGVEKGFDLIDRAASKVVGVLGDAISMAKDEEASIAKLGAALKANVKEWDGNTDAIEKVLGARMKLGFADDEQRDSLALLVAATHDETKALDLQRTAMDLARLKGISLKEASEALVKVEGGQFRLLKSLGIVLKEGATQTEALAAVTKVAGGQAEAYAKTSGGKMLAAQIKVGEELEKLGTELLPLAADGLGLVADAAILVLGPLTDVARLLKGTAPTIGEYREKLAELEGQAGLLGRDEGAIDKLRQKIEFLEDAARAQADGAVWDNLGGKMDEFAQTTLDRAVDVSKALPDALDKSRRNSVRIAAKTPGEIAEALRTGRVTWQDAVEQLGTDLENEMTRAAEIAQIQGFLAGDQLAKGLGSADPIVAAQAEETKRIAEARLLKLVQDARKYGKDTGNTYAAGLESTQHRVEQAASKLAGAVGYYLKVSSPAEKGPLSTLGGPEGWGERTADLYSKGLSGHLPNLTTALGGLPGAGGAIMGGGSPAGGSMSPVVLQINLDGRVLAEVVDERLFRDYRRASATSART